MALVRKRKYSKFLVYAAVFTGVIIIGYLFYYSLSSGKGGPVTNANVMGGTPIIDNFNEDFFKGEKYQSLDDFTQGGLPLQYKNIERGRTNPFALPL